MATFELKMPKLGESITEATITKWLKQEGDSIELDDPILELATDKVDSEIPSPVEGVLKKQLFNEGDTVEVDTVIALIDMDGEDEDSAGEDAEKETGDATEAAPAAQQSDPQPGGKAPSVKAETPAEPDSPKPPAPSGTPEPADGPATAKGADGRFYSPLVRSIARQENISAEELGGIPGTGKSGRITKEDMLSYLKNRQEKPIETQPATPARGTSGKPSVPAIPVGEKDQVVEMDRMRRLIADHMVMSEDTSVHITLFREVNMEKVVRWRNKHKAILLDREGEKLTFTPIFIEAIARALRDFPMVNVSLDGHKIIKRKQINVGMAAALPDGNLIVPVIKNADHKNLLGIAKEVNDLAERARQNKLKPDEIQGGTFTMTNFGTFGASMGTPIINQPQVGILGVGLIRKKPLVIEGPEGDSIGIRHMMDLSLSCDHRIVDGALGGMFLQRVAEYLENFDVNQGI